MRTTVTFRHPAEAVLLSDDDGVLSAAGAAWFVEIARTLPGLEVDADLVQEDWGVVLRARREGHELWLGLAAMDEGEWMAHLKPAGWLQAIHPAARATRPALAADLDRALRQGGASDLQWFDEGDKNLRSPSSSPGPGGEA